MDRGRRPRVGSYGQGEEAEGGVLWTGGGGRGWGPVDRGGGEGGGGSCGQGEEAEGGVLWTGGGGRGSCGQGRLWRE